MPYFLLLLFLLWPQCSVAQSYSTTFSAIENPISEGGRWKNGAADGLDWKNVRTTPGLAFGTMINDSGFDDSTAVLTGTWGSDQAATGVAYCKNPDTSHFEEIELRLRTTITAHSITGYEIDCSCKQSAPGDYLYLVRWNGALNDFTQLTSTHSIACKDGDTLFASVTGNNFVIKINGTTVLTWTDGTFMNGSPGIGFYQTGPDSNNANVGFRSFSATGNLTRVPIGPSSLKVE